MLRRYLTYEGRKKLEVLYTDGESLTNIASKLGIHLATVYRELTRGSTGEFDKNGRYGYSADLGQKHTIENFKRRGKRAGVKGNRRNSNHNRNKSDN